MRWMLAVVTSGLLAGGVAAWLSGDSGLGGVLIRVGAMLGAGWVAFPALVRLDRRTVWLAGVGAAVVLLRPRSAVVVLPLLALFARNAQLRRNAADE